MQFQKEYIHGSTYESKKKKIIEVVYKKQQLIEQKAINISH